MISLSQIENATREDRESGLYDWVNLFKATEWKELMELSKKSVALGNAVVTLAELSDDERIVSNVRRAGDMKWIREL